MKKQELQQIYSRFFNPENCVTLEHPAKRRKRQGTLIWDSSVQGTFIGSIRKTFLNRRKA